MLAETAFHLQDTSLVLAMIRDGLVAPRLVISDHLARLAEMAKRYADRKPDLADLCLIRLSELNPSLPVITTDLRDFRVYRRGTTCYCHHRRQPFATPAPGAGLKNHASALKFQQRFITQRQQVFENGGGVLAQAGRGGSRRPRRG